MRASSVTPVNHPSDFQIDEMFFSTTDSKGVILSGNDVFARVSGYTLAELVGQPHNIIRHPDMPRAVFRLLWATLHQDRPIAALVKNMAKDGRYYWVVALITPVPGGYLSVRFKPSSPLTTQLQELYARMRALEIKQGDSGEAGRIGMDAAEQALGAALGQLGFSDYASFMWKFLHEELKCRDAQTGGIRLQAPGGVAAAAGTKIALLHAIRQGAGQAYTQIDTLYQRLDELTSLHERLAEKTTSVSGHTLNIRFVALSTTVKAAQLGEAGRSLGVIAQYLGEASTRTSDDVQRLAGHLKDISSELSQVIFNLAGARLQLEMMLFFGGELLGAEQRGGAKNEANGVSPQAMIGGLQQAFQGTMVRAVDYLGALGKHLAGLNGAAEEMSRTVLTLHVAQVGGKVEASRIGDDSIRALLDDIHGHIRSTSGELDELADINGKFSTLIRSVPAIAQAIYQTVDRIKREVQQLAGAGPAVASPPSSAESVGHRPGRPTGPAPIGSRRQPSLSRNAAVEGGAACPQDASHVGGVPSPRGLYNTGTWQAG